MSRFGQAKVGFIFCTILLDSMGMGLLIPVMPDIFRRFTGDPSRVSEYFGVFIGLYALMQFIAAPVLGALSDRYGRRSILLVSLLGACLDYLLMAFAPTLSLLFLGRLIAGVTGASMTVASSYMADISDDSNRSANFGMIGAAWGIGFITGPMLGGLIGALGPTAPFIVAALLNLANFLFGFFILPESLPADKRRALAWDRVNPVHSLLRVLRPSPILRLVVIFFIICVAGHVHPVNWTLYTQSKFGWGAWEVGASLSFVGLVFAIAQGVLPRFLIPRLGEMRAMRLGVAFNALGFVLYAISPAGWMMYAVTALTCASGLANPTLQSLIARSVPANEQGELQGSLVSLMSFASILAPLIYTPLFVAFTKPDAALHFPGAAYLGAGAICSLALMLTLRKAPLPPAQASGV